MLHKRLWANLIGAASLTVLVLAGCGRRIGVAGEPELWINDIWGNNPDELFIAVTARLHEPDIPSRAYILWYDGDNFHWF